MCVCMQCWGGLANDGAKLLVLLLMMTVNVNARARRTTKRSWNVHTFARRAVSSREEGGGDVGGGWCVGKLVGGGLEIQVRCIVVVGRGWVS